MKHQMSYEKGTQRRIQMATVTLKNEIPEELYSRFYKVVTDKKGKCRGSKQSAEKAFQTAIVAALQYFLDSLEEPDLAARMIEVYKH
jgi:hypothetical protein